MALTKIIGSGIGTVTNQFADANMASGSILQIVNTQVQTNQSISSSSYTGMSNYNTAITPSSTSSKILIHYGYHVFIANHTSGAWRALGIRLMRVTGDTVLITDGSDYGLGANHDHATDRYMAFASSSFLDSPSTTSATTYGLEGKSTAGISLDVNNPSYAKGGFMTLYEIAG